MDIQTYASFENRCWVNGEWITTQDKIAVYNPYDQSLISEVPRLDAACIEQLIVDMLTLPKNNGVRWLPMNAVVY